LDPIYQEQHLGLPDGSDVEAWEWDAASSLATTINQNYVSSKHTSLMMWTAVYAWYEWLNYPGKGLMVSGLQV
jgi:hypothetical protein